MSRSLSKLLLPPHPLASPSRLLARRPQSNSSADSDTTSTAAAADAEPSLKKLEDAIHKIVVRRSAPDWLPFVPGSSYWVPPKKNGSRELVGLIDRLANPLDDEQVMCTNDRVRGWPCSEFFAKVEAETHSTSQPQLEDEEG